MHFLNWRFSRVFQGLPSQFRAPEISLDISSLNAELICWSTVSLELFIIIFFSILDLWTFVFLPIFFQPWSLFWSACVWSNIGPWLLSLNVSLGLSYPVGMGQHRRLVWTNSFTECLKHTVCFWCTDPRGSAARMTQNWFPVSVINIIASRPLHITGDNLTGKEIHSPPGGRSAAAVP